MEKMTGQNIARLCEDRPYESACIGPLFLYHNTIDTTRYCNASDGRCHNGLTLFFSQSSSGKEFVRPTTIKSRNNIFMGSRQGIQKISPWSVDRGLDFDYDNIWVTSDNELIEWETTDRNENSYPQICRGLHEYQTIDLFKTCQEQELHGQSSIPSFKNTAHGNYWLEKSSRLVDAGAIIPGINDQYHGAAPDIGCFETRHANIAPIIFLLLSD